MTAARALSPLLLLLAAWPARAQQAPARQAPAQQAPAAPAGPSPEELLRRAYEKEYAFLSNEAEALSQRLSELGQERTRRLEAAAAEVQALEARLREGRLALEAGKRHLGELEQTRDGLDDGSAALEAVHAAARTALGAPALEPGAAPARPDLAALEQALNQVQVLLRRRSSVRREEGEFFLASGQATRGSLLRVGAVACLGSSPAGGGPLAPAGAGALQLWEPAPEAALAATQGQLPAALPLYLFESLDHAAERPREKTLAELLRKGGLVGWVIAVLGVLAAVLLVLRTFFLARAAGDPGKLLDRVANHLADGHLEQARGEVAGKRSSAARVVAAMLPHLRDGAEKLESAATERLLQEALRLERFEAAILVSAAVAPLLGLLGTVTGMIATFDVITIYGTGDPKLLSGGISEALITTELGLAVAIPTILAGNLLSGWAEGIRAGAERAALRLTLLAPDSGPPPGLLTEPSDAQELLA